MNDEHTNEELPATSKRADLGRGPRTRQERGLGDRPRSLRARELDREVRREAAPLFDWAVREELAERPRTRGDCVRCPTCEAFMDSGQEPTGPDHRLACGHRAVNAVNHCRPCPRVGCRHHLYLEVLDDGRIRYVFPDKELEDLKETCALDVAELEGANRSTVADLLNMTRERLAELETALYPVVAELLGEEAPQRTPTYADEREELTSLVAEQAFDDEEGDGSAAGANDITEDDARSW